MSVMKEKDKQRKCPKLKKTEEKSQLNSATSVIWGEIIMKAIATVSGKGTGLGSRR